MKRRLTPAVPFLGIGIVFTAIASGRPAFLTIGVVFLVLGVVMLIRGRHAGG